jgi:hypothetical protein
MEFLTLSSPKLATRSALVFLVISGMLAGCSSMKTYPNFAAKNFSINTTTNSGSFFSSVNAALDIYHVNSSCQETYAGTVKLNRDMVEVGIAEEKPSYLSFRFNSSGFWSNRTSTITYETLIRPRKGYRYDVNVSYVDDIYNVDVFEKRSPGSKGKKVPVYHLKDCTKLGVAKK